MSGSAPGTTTTGAPGRIGITATLAGLRARGRILRRRIAAERAHGVARLLALGTIVGGVALVIAGATYGGGWWIAQRGAIDVAQGAVAFALLGVQGALVLSCLGHAATAFFTAHDLWFWESAPAPSWARFLDRASETALTALPSTISLGACALAGFALGIGSGLAGVARALVALVLVAILPLCAGIVLAHVGGALLPAGKLRRLSLVVLGVALTALLVVVRRARVEELVSAKGAERLVESARTLREVGAPWWPHNIGARFVVDADLAAGALLVGIAALALAVGVVVHAQLFDRARSRAADESPKGLRRHSWPERALVFLARPLPGDLQPLVEKDALALVRDPAQWGQVILLVGVAVLYLVNCAALVEGFQALPFARDIVLAGVHTGIATFIAAGLAVRFAFPQLGLEGPAVWILEAAPLGPARVVRAKWLSALPITAAFPTLTGAIGGFVLDLPVALHLVTTVVIALSATAFALYAVGRGAERAAFDAVSVSELAFGPGALGTMAATIALSGVASAFVFVAAALIVRLGDTGLVPGVVSALLPLPLSFTMAVRAAARGASGFAYRRVEGAAGREGIGR